MVWRPIRDPQGFALGLLFLAIAIPVILLASGYRPGTATEMGPGYFPRLVGWALAVVGILVMLGALNRPGPSVEWRSAVRPVAILLASIFAFAFLVVPLGIVAAVVLLMLSSSLAGRDTRWAGALVGAVLVAAACAQIFVGWLGLQVPVWPWFLR